MIEEFVALDVETTGLDPRSERLIEVGAVRFTRAGVVARYRSFIDPGKPIPLPVVALTGIRDVDLRNAPPQERVLRELAAFVGDRPVVGHNVRFDIEFLAAAGWRPEGRSIDTYDLASILLPTATRRDLTSLAERLAVPMPVAHRALADAETTGEVLLRLLDRFEALSEPLRHELAGYAAAAETSLGTVLGGLSAPTGWLPTPGGEIVPAPARRGAPPLEFQPGRPPVSVDDVRALFTLAGQRPDLVPGFEQRPGQLELAINYARRLEYGGALLAEAGTGTGKSLAYLLPGLLHAVRHGDRVVVSTHTLNLQEQLAARDLPSAAALVEAFEGSPAGTAQFAVLKGRGNYICLDRWARARERVSARPPGETRLLSRIAVWLGETADGDVAELALPDQERQLWAPLSAEGADCLSRRCQFVRDDRCFLQRARARAIAAHVVVVNHALLLANAAMDEQVLPPFRHVVIDEAHRLEEVATQQYGTNVSPRDLEGLALAAGAGDGSLAQVLRTLPFDRTAALRPSAGLATPADLLVTAAGRLQERAPLLHGALQAYMIEFGPGADRANPVPQAAGQTEARPGAERQAQVTPGRRSQEFWEAIEEAAMQADLALLLLGQRLGEVQNALDALPAEAAAAVEGPRSDARRLAEQTATARTALQRSALRSHASDEIVWVAEQGRATRLYAAPLDVSDQLAADLYAGRSSVLATSATLTAAGRFDFTAGRLGLDDPDTLVAASPFDYRRAVLTLIVDDVPTPDEHGYAAAVHEALAEAARGAGGRTLALFTSHGAVRAAANALRGELAADGIAVLAQQVDGAPGRLLRSLVAAPRTMVLGTAAFWEGVDVRGDALSQLAIARLPFPPPNDPIYAGRAALYDDPFDEYALPQAILRFRQGFGRLIRGSDERGVFLVLDRRVLTRSYGSAFLDSLPDCEVRRVRTANLADSVAAWLLR